MKCGDCLNCYPVIPSINNLFVCDYYIAFIKPEQDFEKECDVFIPKED